MKEDGEGPDGESGDLGLRVESGGADEYKGVGWSGKYLHLASSQCFFGFDMGHIVILRQVVFR